MYWPYMNNDIGVMVKNCTACMKFSPAQCREPLQLHESPKRSWQTVGRPTDLHAGGTNYLVVTHYYSVFPEVMQPPSVTSHAVITSMKAVFARHGVPDIVISDKRLQYSRKESETLQVIETFSSDVKSALSMI